MRYARRWQHKGISAEFQSLTAKYNLGAHFQFLTRYRRPVQLRITVVEVWNQIGGILNVKRGADWLTMRIVISGQELGSYQLGPFYYQAWNYETGLIFRFAAAIRQLCGDPGTDECFEDVITLSLRSTTRFSSVKFDTTRRRYRSRLSLGPLLQRKETHSVSSYRLDTPNSSRSPLNNTGISMFRAERDSTT